MIVGNWKQSVIESDSDISRYEIGFRPQGIDKCMYMSSWICSLFIIHNRILRCKKNGVCTYSLRYTFKFIPM